MKDIKLNEKTYWVGKNDNRDVPFHRLILTKGTTYNSYLLDTQLPTIIDTVDMQFGKEYVENLEKLISLDKIKYIVINHTEPDHSGGLMLLSKKATNATIVCSEHAVYELKEMYRLHNREFLVVKTGDKLDIGGKTLSFIETPYLHTEETMVTYCDKDKILYSCDIFSTHIANEELFNDLAKEDITEDFKVYYSLIMNPHRLYVHDMLSKIKDLDIKIIAPSHGYVLRDDAKKYISLYEEMSRNTDTDKKALILYSSMTGNTKKIADKISEIYSENNINISAINVNKTSLEEIQEKIIESDIIFFGTSTRYADMIGNLEVVLKELASMDLQDKIGVAFGSYGWSGEPIEITQDYLKASTLETLETSHVIKTTGMTDVYFPIRLRFSLNEENKKILTRAINYTIERVLSN